jgi:hypothetical protein
MCLNHAEGNQRHIIEVDKPMLLPFVKTVFQPV